MNILIRTCGPSNGAVALRNTLREQGLDARISRRTRFRRTPIIINWGCTAPAETDGRVLNSVAAIEVARNKLTTFSTLKEQGFESMPTYWTVPPSTEERGKDIILERHSLTGESGAGIVVRRGTEALGTCPLYVRYVRKRREFRVHVFNNAAVAVQEKKRESDTEQSADQKLIRNRDNGWVFCVMDIAEPEGLRDIAVDAVSKLGLDFGAVDMILGKDDKLYVLEVNTKPGLESTTVLNAYAQAIQRMTRDDNDDTAHS